MAQVAAAAKKNTDRKKQGLPTLQEQHAKRPGRATNPDTNHFNFPKGTQHSNSEWVAMHGKGKKVRVAATTHICSRLS